MKPAAAPPVRPDEGEWVINGASVKDRYKAELERINKTPTAPPGRG